MKKERWTGTEAPFLPGATVTLSPKQAADLLGCSRRFVYVLFERGELEGYRLGRGIRIFPESVPAYVERHRNRKPDTAPPPGGPATPPPPRRRTTFTAFRELHL